VHRVTAQIRPRIGGDLGEVTEGFYFIDGNSVVLSDGEGHPIEVQGEWFNARLREGDIPHVIAGRLAKAAYYKLNPVFESRLVYPTFPTP